MTLNTKITLAGDHIDANVLWEQLLYMLTVDLAPGTLRNDTAVYDEEVGEGFLTRRTRPGQGLPAWTTMTVLYTSAEVSFDTGYGYHDEKGRGCTALHADFIRLLHHWATERGLTLSWINEYTGEEFDGLDGLDQFSPRRPVTLV